MSALFHLMAHRRVASVHMQHGNHDGRSLMGDGYSSSNAPHHRPPLASLRVAESDREPPEGDEAAPGTAPHWGYRVVLPLAFIVLAIVEVGCIGIAFGWWK